jgi:hypothetical protein
MAVRRKTHVWPVPDLDTRPANIADEKTRVAARLSINVPPADVLIVEIDGPHFEGDIRSPPRTEYQRDLTKFPSQRGRLVDRRLDLGNQQPMPDPCDKKQSKGRGTGEEP